MVVDCIHKMSSTRIEIESFDDWKANDILPNEDFVHVLMLIVVVVQDELSFQILVELNAEDIPVVGIQDIPVNKDNCFK